MSPSSRSSLPLDGNGVEEEKARLTSLGTSFLVLREAEEKSLSVGCIHLSWVGCLHRIEGTMDAKMYRHILEDSLLGTLHDHRLGPSTIIFQHDNDLKHTARLVQEWLEHQNLLVLPWPPSSPDLNIIENVWAEIKKRLETYRPRPRNTEELWRVVQKLCQGGETNCSGSLSSFPSVSSNTEAFIGLLRRTLPPTEFALVASTIFIRSRSALTMYPGQTTISLTERVPAEIWLEIFEQVPARADLHSISITCRKFHDLTKRPLHRDLAWVKPIHVVRSLPVWDANPGMDAAVRSLVLGVSTVPDRVYVPIVDLNGHVESAPEWTPGGRASENAISATLNHYDLNTERKGGFASRALHEAMFARIATFTNISSLTLSDMLVYDMHFELIHRLPLLRSLRLEFCLFQDRAGSKTFNHATLPITDLTMLNLRRKCNAFFAHQVSYDEDLTHVWSLCVAQDLRTLTVDSTADVFRHIYGAWDANTRGWSIPEGLENVYVLRRRLFDGEVQPLFYGENNFPETHLYHFAVQARNLRTLSTPMFVPQNMHVAPEALSSTLQRFAAPVETAMFIAAVRSVQALGVLKCGLGNSVAINALETIARSRPDLKMLMLELRGWDEEVVPAVVQLFKEMRRLKILFEGEVFPSEDFLVMLAPEYLAKMPNLHTLELYPQPRPGSLKPDYPAFLYDKSYDSIEEELRNLVIPYNRYCPKLRKVQVCAGYIMKRVCEGGPWEIERVRQYEEKDDLGF
ncbi:hypothetical protein BN946_scf184926.g1 [Trametes cinnabarina]|uniref:F-box domain-containing protein n=1 Tax=Pycnoporus cinnabarinus TaxID=5643 RepID=A0A060SZ65_PYCCI|nr:hypothetical protein BN946_scf184926.g1 [Trametes cinnabarina]